MSLYKTAVIAALFLHIGLYAQERTITRLTRTDPVIEQLRADISNSIYIIKSKRNVDTLPELTFYSYTVKDGDNLWNIIARTSLDMDTLLTVNRLESPSDLTPGTVIYIPNMRGIVVDVQSSTTLDFLERKYDVSHEYITRVNRMESLSKPHVFIPCGTLTREERSAFLSTGFGHPVSPVRITSGFGMRKDPFLNVPRFHSGIDIGCKTGTPIKASKGGVVSFSGYMKDYGNLVIIAHDGGYKSYYGHLHRITVAKSQTVKRGTIIAYSGNTGRSTGPHLHFEIRKDDKPVNPLSHINGKQ
ncbi:MAG: LysM peptidoglycan-binding domain-containing M23 family metallopeptidase [Spirochaetota bacterium]